jgi:hypothetical protein
MKTTFSEFYGILVRPAGFALPEKGVDECLEDVVAFKTLYDELLTMNLE